MNNVILHPVAVAIPVRNEAEWIGRCLEALYSQVGVPIDHLVLLLNNCTDATEQVVRSVPPNGHTRLHVIKRVLEPKQANAGHARHLAMNEAAALVGEDGVLMTTDADGQVDPDWTAATLAALRSGAEVVAGWVELDPIDWGSIPARLHEDDAKECAYDALCDEIHAWLDPDLDDPWPRHTQHSGASIALTAAAFHRCGGVPDVPCGEDRALIAALRAVDASVRHAPEVHVTVSGRTTGRAAGGMADTIRRRLSTADEFLDGRLEPASDCVRRACARAASRVAFSSRGDDPAELADWLGIQLDFLEQALASPYFGQAWQVIEQGTPLLRRRPVPVADLPQQMDAALAYLAAKSSHTTIDFRSFRSLGLGKRRPSLPAGAGPSDSLQDEGDEATVTYVK